MVTEINIRRNEPFQVTPGLDQVVQPSDEAEICLEEINFVEPDLGIRGRLRFLEVRLDPDYSCPIVSPAGKILPVMVDVLLDNLTRKQINKVGFYLTYGANIYRGKMGYDKVELERTGRTESYFMIWRNENDEEAMLIFRREDLPSIQYTLKYPNS